MASTIAAPRPPASSQILLLTVDRLANRPMYPSARCRPFRNGRRVRKRRREAIVGDSVHGRLYSSSTIIVPHPAFWSSRISLILSIHHESLNVCTSLIAEVILVAIINHYQDRPLRKRSHRVVAHEKLLSIFRLDWPVRPTSAMGWKGKMSLLTADNRALQAEPAHGSQVILTISTGQKVRP